MLYKFVYLPLPVLYYMNLQSLIEVKQLILYLSMTIKPSVIILHVALTRIIVANYFMYICIHTCAYMPTQ